ncbi:MAG: molybdopterin synthase sulfur carrier subunit [Haloarculaceae archaeon]|jgi:molybdopterin synthase sulfur carrier subunit
MEITMRFFASFRDEAGQKVINREYDDVSTVGDLARTLSEEYPGMELFDDDGSLREFISIMRNGEDVTHLDGLETTLEDGDTVSMFPPVAGG